MIAFCCCTSTRLRAAASMPTASRSIASACSSRRGLDHQGVQRLGATRQLKFCVLQVLLRAAQGLFGRKPLLACVLRKIRRVGQRFQFGQSPVMFPEQRLDRAQFGQFVFPPTQVLKGRRHFIERSLRRFVRAMQRRPLRAVVFGPPAERAAARRFGAARR